MFPPKDTSTCIPASEYTSLEKALRNRLQALYTSVVSLTIPPWREEVASIYFLVARPIPPGTLKDARLGLKDALGAQHYRTASLGSPVSILAVPIPGAPGPPVDNLDSNSESGWYKVEVHECQTEDELNCSKFYLSYGDLGVILSRMARVHGLLLGSKGLKTHYTHPDDMNISGYLLSTSPENILGFYGLPVETWKHGFQTQEEVFAWLKKSWLYKPMLLVEADAMSRRKLDPALREMYFAFIKLADADSNDQLKGVPNLDSIRNIALNEFGKKDDYDGLVLKKRLDRSRREKLNGKKIIQWSNSKWSGTFIRDIMNEVHCKIGDIGLIEHDESALKAITLQIGEELTESRSHMDRRT